MNNIRSKMTGEKALGFLFLISVFLLSILKIDDSDAFMHISLGREIFRLRGFPATEPFSFPSLESPFFYTQWLFGLVYYMAYRVFDLYGVILLKAATITSVFYMLLKDSLRPYKNYAVSVAVLAVIVFMVRHRFIERPDTFMMLFLSFSVLSLNAFVYDGKRYLYALPLVHLLWANSHTSIVLMHVPFLSFIAGGLLQKFLSGKGLPVCNIPSFFRLRPIILIYALSFAASLITPAVFTNPAAFTSPAALSQYTSGAQVLESDWWRMNIRELIRPMWEFNKWPYVMTAALVLSFALNLRRISIIHLLMTIPFVYLAFTANRFIFLLGIATSPVLARNISQFIEAQEWKGFFLKVRPVLIKAVFSVIAIWLVLSTGLLMAGAIRPYAEQERRFGFGINYSYFPEGALKYMDRKGIYGGVFNALGWGGYINWRDYPQRLTFVDGRASLSRDLLKKMDQALQKPAVLDELQQKFGFESILVPYPTLIRKSLLSDIFLNEDQAVSNPQWELVYWDDVGLLYLKKGGKYDPFIKADAYRSVRPANFSAVSLSGMHDQAYRSSVIAELQRNIRESGSSKAHYLLGSIYNDTGEYQEALKSFSGALHTQGKETAGIYKGLAYAYARLGTWDEAVDHYKKALAKEDSPSTLYSLGLCYISKGDKKSAVRFLKRAQELNPYLLSAYAVLVSIYKELGMQDELTGVKQTYRKYADMQGGEEHFRKAQQAYLGQKLDTAYAEYEQAIAVNPLNPLLYSSLGYVAYDMGMLERAYEYQRMATDIDPNYANAHYGLALISRKWGDQKTAKKHWEEYLGVEPAGHYSDRAREELKALQR